MSKLVLAVALAVTALISTGLLVHHLTKKTEAPHTLSVEVPTPVFDAWSHWKKTHKKTYGGAQEESHRLTIFNQNYNKVKAHQQNEQRSYDMSMNQFMDLTAQEFKALYLSTHINTTSKNVQTLINEVAPSVDWRTKGVVSDIKDQGMCGSCWAFSTTGALEALAAIKGKGKLLFSEQQLVDCSSSYGNQGCNGGLMDQGFSFVKDNGITTEDKYPYKAVDQRCKTKGGDFKVSGFVDVPAGDVNQLAAAVNLQPVSIAVDAESWQFYSGGVFSDCSENLDHGVLLVGYTSDAWIVKNSWGTSWGENGYIRLKRGNTCGLANAASYPTL